jgi:PAP2 superfamily
MNRFTCSVLCIAFSLLWSPLAWADTVTDWNANAGNAAIIYNYWRPVTAIQLADIDGNPDTIAGQTWEPLELTPPNLDYDSGHSVEGGAAVEVLRRVFKIDQISFSTCSLTLPLIEEQYGGVNELRRSYSSFSQAADENGVSRICVGYHFRIAVEEGIKHGRKIGKRAVEHFLKPVD